MTLTVKRKDINGKMDVMMKVLPEFGIVDVSKQDVIGALLWLDRQGKKNRKSWEKEAEKIREVASKINNKI